MPIGSPSSPSTYSMHTKNTKATSSGLWQNPKQDKYCNSMIHVNINHDLRQCVEWEELLSLCQKSNGQSKTLCDSRATWRSMYVTTCLRLMKPSMLVVHLSSTIESLIFITIMRVHWHNNNHLRVFKKKIEVLNAPPSGSRSHNICSKKPQPQKTL